MEKEYIAPAITCVAVDTESICAASLTVNGLEGINGAFEDEKVPENDFGLGKGHQSVWGADDDDE